MKKLQTLAAMVVAAIIGIIFLAGLVQAGTAVAVFSEPGLRDGPLIDAAKITHVEIIGGLPAASTSTVSRIVGTKTNTIATIKLTNGAGSVIITNGYWVLRGDTLLWSGGTTSGKARAVFSDN